MVGKQTARVFCVVIIISVLCHVHCKIIASFVLPHGGIALDPRFFYTTNKTAKILAEHIHQACVNVGQSIANDIKPDLIFLSSPHGVADLDRFAFYLNTRGAGQADTDNCFCPPCCYNISVPMDGQGAFDLVHRLIDVGHLVTGLSGFGPAGQSSEPFPLRWGEVIPLIFIPTIRDIPVIVMTMPDRRYQQASSEHMILELLHLGQSLYKYLEEDTRRVVVMISADLAHTHSADGPYGFSNASEPFDKACTQWVETSDDNWLLGTARGYVDKALSCGYPGLVMLSGILGSARHSGNSKNSWNSTLWASGHPSYYGMMVASFIRTAENKL